MFLAVFLVSQPECSSSSSRVLRKRSIDQTSMQPAASAVWNNRHCCVCDRRLFRVIVTDNGVLVKNTGQEDSS